MYKETENIPTPYHLHQFLWTSPRFTGGQDTDHSAGRLHWQGRSSGHSKRLGNFQCARHIWKVNSLIMSLYCTVTSKQGVFFHILCSVQFCFLQYVHKPYTVWQLIMIAGWVFTENWLFVCVCACVHTCARACACMCVCVCESGTFLIIVDFLALCVINAGECLLSCNCLYNIQWLWVWPD